MGIQFRDNGEEHNFWQNYTDLMSGLLIIFIITSIITWHKKDYLENENNKLSNKYEELVKSYRTLENGLGGNGSIIIREQKKIDDFFIAMIRLENEYFYFNEKYKRFESKFSVEFLPNSSTIPPNKRNILLKAGKKLEGIINEFSKSTIVSFKIILEGRAARHLESSPEENEALNQKDWKYVETLSYNRARNLYDLWKKTTFSHT